MQPDFFGKPEREPIDDGAVVLRGFCADIAPQLVDAVNSVAARAPFRHMITPGGKRMSVAMTSCGEYGWVTDRKGYRYSAIDPGSDKPWPAMPALIADLATRAAARAGFENFAPDSCLINRYTPGTRLSLHQDRDERDFTQPIVSVSLGIAATFLFGGAMRTDRVRRVPLQHGDVVVWGGAARLHHHGIAPLPDDRHPLLGAARINLTLRKSR